MKTNIIKRNTNNINMKYKISFAAIEKVRITTKIQKWNNNTTVKDDETYYISKSDRFGGGNTLTEVMTETARIKSNIQSI